MQSSTSQVGVCFFFFFFSSISLRPQNLPQCRHTGKAGSNISLLLSKRPEVAERQPLAWLEAHSQRPVSVSRVVWDLIRMGHSRQKSAGERVFPPVGDHLVWYQVRVLKLECAFLCMFSSMIWKDPKVVVF